MVLAVVAYNIKSSLLTITFFLIELNKNFLLAHIKTWWFCKFWAIKQVSTTSGYKVTLFRGILPPMTDLGGLPAPGRWQLTLTNFFLLFLDYCQNLQTMLFSISKNDFFHSTLLSSATQFEFCDVDIACLYYLICIKIQIHHKTYYFNVI